MALDLFLVRIMTRKRSGNDLFNGNYDGYYSLPRDPIGRLLRIYALIVFVIPEVLETVKDHNDTTLAISSSWAISLTVLLRIITTSTHLRGDRVAYEVKATWKVDTKFIINDVYKASLHVGELLSQLNKSTMNERLILSFARGSTCHMY
jgi:hypothetical protein